MVQYREIPIHQWECMLEIIEIIDRYVAQTRNIQTNNNVTPNWAHSMCVCRVFSVIIYFDLFCEGRLKRLTIRERKEYLYSTHVQQCRTENVRT